MANNRLYDHGRNDFAKGDIHWKVGGDTFKVTVVDLADYTPDFVNDHYMNTNTIPLIARLATGTLTVLDPVAGVMDADDVALGAITGDVAELLIVWKDGGEGGVSAAGTLDRLLMHIDTGAGLPITPIGGTYSVVWNVSGIAKL